MVRRNPLVLGLVEDDMAEIADAEEALQSVWLRLRAMAYRPRLTPDDFDEVSKDLRTIGAGLAAGKRGVIQQREAVP